MRKFSIITSILLVAIMALPQHSFARNYVMCVGLSKYQNARNNLRVSDNDAKAIKKIYEKNGDSKVTILTNSSATRQAVLKALKTAFTGAKANDAVIFFFSGHGSDKGLACYDNVIKYEQILAIIKKSPARTKVIIADACHSGTMRTNTAWQRAMKKEKVMFFLSSRSEEVSWESKYDKSLFTMYLERGLRGGADFNHDRVITAREIYDFCHDGVIKSSDGQQHPVMWGKFNDNMPVISWRARNKEYRTDDTVD